MRIKANDIELYYEQHGKGEPFVLSHGWLGDRSIWSAQVKHFAANYSVVIYDHRGHGESDKPRGDYAVQTLSNDMYSLTQKLNLENPTLVGFSLGGMAAILFALKHPDKLSKLVLVGTTAKMTLPVSTKLFGIISYVLPYERLLRTMCKYRFYQPSRQMLEEEIVRARKVDRHVANECWKELSKNYDVRDRVSGIKVPTLIIVGEEDKINLDASKYLNNEIDSSELRIMPATGHTVMIEKPDEFNQLVQQFIAEK